MAAARDLDERRHTLAQSVRESERAIERCTSRLDARKRDAAALRDAIAMKEAVIAHAETRIGNERMKLAELIGRQREVWSS